MTPKETDTPATELCILCGADTKIPINKPIACRNGYIVGCGQLCARCAGELDLENPAKLNAADMQMLITKAKKED